MKTMQGPITGLTLEQTIDGMGLSANSIGARDTLIALCNRADGAGKDISLSLISKEAKRLMPDLRRYGIAKASQLLSRNIEILDGELFISPYKEPKEVE